MKFRKSGEPKLSPESARRQGDVTRMAMLLLGREKAIAFMNDENAHLGGRPIDLAVASDEGRRLIEAELARLTKA